MLFESNKPFCLTIFCSTLFHRFFLSWIFYLCPVLLVFLYVYNPISSFFPFSCVLFCYICYFSVLFLMSFCFVFLLLFPSFPFPFFHFICSLFSVTFPPYLFSLTYFLFSAFFFTSFCSFFSFFPVSSFPISSFPRQSP